MNEMNFKAFHVKKVMLLSTHGLLLFVWGRGWMKSNCCVSYDNAAQILLTQKGKYCLNWTKVAALCLCTVSEGFE